MLTVTIDNRPFNFDAKSLKTLTELVEVVKMSIDPDTIIAAMALDGKDLSDADWRSALSVFSGRTLQIVTSSREKFLVERLEIAGFYIDRIREQFAKAMNAFKQTVGVDAHNALSQAVQELKAFVDWYESILQLLPPGRGDVADAYHVQIKRITEVCEQILQQQLYRAWWALSETIERKLDPELERLKGQCLKTAANG